MILLYLGFLRRFYSVSNYSPKYEDQHYSVCFSSPRGLGDLTLYSKQGRETLQSRPYYSCEIERQITQHLFLFFQSLFSYVWLIILPV